MEAVHIVTIDGPCGSGKGTIASLLVNRLGWHLLDSGSLYRLIAFEAIRKELALDNEKVLAALASSLRIEFMLDENTGLLKIVLNGQRVEQIIRQENIGLAASKVAQLPAVRSSILVRQRAFARAPGLVADGRDMGTIVFPEAGLKIFLTAGVEERAKRRYLQLRKQKVNVSIERILEDVKERDLCDARRKLAPLVPAKDAIVLDSTGLGIEQVRDKILDILSSRGMLQHQ